MQVTGVSSQTGDVGRALHLPLGGSTSPWFLKTSPSQEPRKNPLRLPRALTPRGAGTPVGPAGAGKGSLVTNSPHTCLFSSSKQIVPRYSVAFLAADPPWPGAEPPRALQAPRSARRLPGAPERLEFGNPPRRRPTPPPVGH